MSLALAPDVVVYICHHSMPTAAALPRQWTQHDAHVAVHEVPCSGKIDAQYLLHALEGGARGVCLVTCPKGTCHLSQGNYRAEVRIGTVQRLLGEVGLEPGRAELLRSAADDRPRNSNKPSAPPWNAFAAWDQIRFGSRMALALPVLAVEHTGSASAAPASEASSAQP